MKRGRTFGVRRPASAAVLAALILVVITPAIALACPVCALNSTGDNQGAYTAMSVILSVLPLGMMAGGARWLYRRNAAREAAETIGASAPKDGGAV